MLPLVEHRRNYDLTQLGEQVRAEADSGAVLAELEALVRPRVAATAAD